MKFVFSVLLPALVSFSPAIVSAQVPTVAPPTVPERTPIAVLSPATAIDLSSGNARQTGAVSTGQQIYRFDAVAGSKLDIAVNVTSILPGQAFTDDDSQLFLFDSAGQLLASNDDDGGSFESRLPDFTVPADGTYFVVVTTFNNDPVLSDGAIVTGWGGDGGSNIEYVLTVTTTPP